MVFLYIAGVLTVGQAIHFLCIGLTAFKRYVTDGDYNNPEWMTTTALVFGQYWIFNFFDMTADCHPKPFWKHYYHIILQDGICTCNKLGMLAATSLLNVLFMFVLLVIMMFAWPIVLAVVLFYGFMRSIRFSFRLSRSVCELAGVSHKHGKKDRVIKSSIESPRF